MNKHMFIILFIRQYDKKEDKQAIPATFGVSRLPACVLVYAFLLDSYRTEWVEKQIGESLS